MENQKSGPKDVFLHLLAIISLYMNSGALMVLLFQYINVLFPDKLNPPYYETLSGPIRGSMASLIIVFPVFLIVSWLLQNDYKSDPAKKEIKIRKWLVYFTLFATAVIIIGDLVALVYNFLSGELTAQFLLRVGVIFMIAGTIFGYYMADLKNKLNAFKIRAFAGGVGAVVLISVIAGFFTVGSPLKARLYRFDSQRLSDLQIIQSEIVSYWKQKEKLPASLDDLKNSISGFAAPLDPENNSPYEYRVTGNLTFELCGNFGLASMGLIESVRYSEPMAYKAPYPYAWENWQHDAGRVCFSRTIDPDLYRDTQTIKIIQ